MARTPTRYTVEQVRYPSTDGTDVTMFLIHSAATTPGPDTPTMLTGYGGFNVTMNPAYSPVAVSVCDRGGMYAVACIRGGAEEGEDWHQAGMRANKQQGFDDFYAAADWLVAQGLTSRERLAVRGGSNGGLLMGAVVTQRPDLCRAVVCQVPLLDMIRFPRFRIAKLWIPEYGDPDIAEEFAWLYAYSPYHHVVEGTCYPAALITDGRGGQPGRRQPRPQDGGAVAGGHVVRRRAADPVAGRDQGRPRPGQARVEAGRRVHRRAGVRGVAAQRRLNRACQSAARAAFAPQAPWTPPPGWAEADAR